MKNKPFFSIVIPTFNRGDLITGTILSVLEQDYQSFELIIVDDGSTDDTHEVISAIKDERLQYFKIHNSERGAARNAGIRKASGEYVNFIDSDDCVYPKHLTTAFNFIQIHQYPPVFHLAYDIRYKNGKVLQKPGRIKNINKEILSGNVLSCNGVFIRHDVMMTNLFNEDRALAALEDWELWVRLAAGFPFLHLDEITSSVIQHEKRSVMTKNVSIIKQKVNAFINAVGSDDANQRAYGKKINRLYASVNTYAALHIVLTGRHKKDAFRYLWKGIGLNSSEIFKKRFLVIIKWMLFK